MRKYYALIIFLTFLSSSSAKDSTSSRPIYKINIWVDISITAIGGAATYFGLNAVNEKPVLSEATINSLNSDHIPWIDRSAAFQDPAFASTAHDISDYIMKATITLPFFLAFDREIRSDYHQILLLYIQAEFVTTSTYLCGASLLTNRIRPFVYNLEEPLEKKLEKGATNSFYSGHTASTAAASFFMAKVYSDYHLNGRNKLLIYGLALLPPTAVGFYRYKAGKHFLTDILTGLVAGAATGILIPHLHKTKDREMAIVPFINEYKGIVMSLKF